MRGNTFPALTATVRWHPTRSPDELRDVEVLFGLAWSGSRTERVLY